MKHDRTYFLYGILPVLAASTLWAFGYFARKIALYEITPFTLTCLTSFIVGAFLWLFFRQSPRHLWNLFKTHIRLFLGLSICGVILGGTLMYIALDHLDLGLANMLEKLQPLFVVVMAYYALNERYSKQTLIFCAAALLSSWMIAAGEPGNLTLGATDFTGLLAVIGAALAWAAATIFGKKLMMAGLRSRDVTTIRFLLASALAMPFFLLQPDLPAHLDLSLKTWGIIVVAALLATGLGYVLYYMGLRQLEASVSNFLELTTPVISLILGIIFLGEHLTNLQIFFIPLMLFSVYKISSAKKIKQVEPPL